MFTQEPTVELSILCFDPDFYDPIPVILSGNTTGSASSPETPVLYEGTVDTGIVFKLMPQRLIYEVTIFHRPPNDDLRSLEVDYTLNAGDVLTVTTISGKKSVILTISAELRH